MQRKVKNYRAKVLTRFAFFPMVVGDRWIWLRRYYIKYFQIGLYRHTTGWIPQLFLDKAEAEKFLTGVEK